jgi:Rad3-related DNA helicase
VKKSDCTPEEWEAYKTYQRNWYRSQPENIKKKIIARTVAQQRTPGQKLRKHDWHRKTKYGLTPKQFDDMVAAQNGCCALCLKPQERTMNVDHDHKTNAVRDLLCNWCNTFIGLLENNPGLISSGQAYLARHAAAT